jgi:class 3 adenylate cyclase/tetratricopeptide (TPR) repeat protein
VSVLFADLTGFTSFSEARDAEDVRETLSEYFEMSRRIVDSYGGRVEKFIGDAVMALWGAPVANEDDAERAVRAGLDLVAAVFGLGDRLGVDLRLRVGVLTGVAAVELDAVDEGMVIGDAINTASRIQSLAEPGSVLVDDVTRAVTHRSIAYEDGGAHFVKGKSAPVHTWRALRVVGAVGGAERTDLEPPLVGRATELGVIKGALDGLIASEAGLRLVTVAGEPGLGKSRLAWELKKYADGLAATVLWHHGQAMSFEGAGFSSLADMVRARAEIDPNEPSSVSQSKLEGLANDAFGSDDPGRDQVLRGLGRLLGLDDGQELIDRGELFSAWRLLFEQLSAEAPVVMLFEDLQWADQGLFDFIAHLCAWASRARILVLVFSRPDERLDELAKLGERIDLQPLDDEDIEALIGGAVEEAPAGLVSGVREHAAGVPLFAVESLRMLADRGIMAPAEEANRYRLVADVDDLDVPPSIHSLVAARLDRLGDLERQVLRGGAVFGQAFGLTAAAVLAGLSTGAAEPVLERLVGRQFLTRDTDPRSQTRGTYSFVHKAVQRVVLSTLSKRERKARHLAAVDYLSAHHSGPDLAAIQAEHLLAAHGAYPDAADAVDIRRRALTLTLEAGERAESVGALNEAVTLFAQAAEIDEAELARAEHHVRAARCAELYGHLEEVAAGHYAAARELHEQVGDEREALRLRARELNVYQWSQEASGRTEPLQKVYETLRGRQDAAFADAAALLGQLLYANGSAAAAEAIAAEAVAAAEASGANLELGVALNLRACALIELARPEEAVEVFQAAHEIWERYSPSDVPGSLGNIAIALAALGRFQEAVTAGRQAIDAAERFASRVHRNLAALQLARSHFSLGQWDQAVQLVDSVAGETAPANRGMVIGPPLLVAIHRGETQRARAIIAEFDQQNEADSGAAFESDYRSLHDVALAHLNQSPGPASEVIATAQSGDYAEWPTWLPLAVDLIAQATNDEPLIRAAAALGREMVPMSSPIVTAQVARVDALLRARSGETGEAAAKWFEAIGIASGAGMDFDAAALMLERFEHVPDAPGALDGLRAAADTFTKLRATPWSRRVPLSATTR